MSSANPIVFVHGFWLDASSYSQIIARLLIEDYEVISVQNPLTSLADDVAATRRALDRVKASLSPPGVATRLGEAHGCNSDRGRI
jgi:pimeloyl-ACP methyl ester carboxylesterase